MEIPIYFKWSLNDFYACLAAHSEEQTFEISATNLVSPVVVTAPVGYEVSSTSNGTFSNSISFAGTMDCLSTKYM